MGHYDLEKLLYIKKLCRQVNPKYNFTVDVDTEEGQTRVYINDDGVWFRARNVSEEEAVRWKSWGYKIFVPDLADFTYKLIIEYQEEPKPNKGYMKAKITKKGHDELSDTDKDTYYYLAGFKQLKVWEHWKDEDIITALEKFLI